MISKHIDVLRNAGFEIRPTVESEAIGCTLIKSEEPFWFLNPRFDVYVKKADEKDGKFFIIIAQDWTQNNELPFKILDAKSFEEYRNKVEAIERAIYEENSAKTFRANLQEELDSWLGGLTG